MTPLILFYLQVQFIKNILDSFEVHYECTFNIITRAVQPQNTSTQPV